MPPGHRLRQSGPARPRRLFALVTATTGSMFVAGTTGEFPALEDAEDLALAAITPYYLAAEPAEVMACYREIATAGDGAGLYA